jgi:chromosome segregation ATPase
MKIQPGSNDSRRIFYITPPPGLAVERLFAMVQKAESKIRLTATPTPATATTPGPATDILPDPEEEENLPDELSENEGDSGPVSFAPAAMEGDEDRLMREYYELDAQRADAQGKASESRRRLPGMEREHDEFVRAAERLDKELSDLRQRLILLESEREAASKRVQDSSQALADLRTSIEVDEAMASEAEIARDQREASLKEIARQNKIAAAARALEAVKGLSLEDLLEAMRRAGVDVSAVSPSSQSD